MYLIFNLEDGDVPDKKKLPNLFSAKSINGLSLEALEMQLENDKFKRGSFGNV